jgi:hypothetical protein
MDWLLLSISMHDERFGQNWCQWMFNHFSRGCGRIHQMTQDRRQDLIRFSLLSSAHFVVLCSSLLALQVNGF